MNKILVPTDFSKNALKAATYASEIAVKSGATVFLLHVMAPDVNLLMDSVGQSNVFMAQMVSEDLDELETIRKSIQENFPSVKVETELARGTIITAILDFAELQQPDLIIMGTTGASGMKEFFMGSVAVGIISQSKIPVITIPVSYEMEEPDAILLATHHFEKDPAVLSPVITLSRLYGASIYVALFADTDQTRIPEYKNYVAQLNDYTGFLKNSYPCISFKGEVLDGTDFEVTLDRYSNKNEVDIIAMITHPRGFTQSIFRKNVAKKMAFHSTIPLLMIPASRLQEQKK